MRPDSPILLFHAVGSAASTGYKDAVTPEELDRALAWLQAHYRVVPLDELLQRSRHGQPLAGLAALTFDDNHRSVAEVALPLAAARGLPATWFVMTGPLAGRPYWRRQLTRLLAEGQEAAFLAFLAAEAPDLAGKLRPGRLYKDSKDPSRVASDAMAALIASFTQGRDWERDEVTAGEIAAMTLPGVTLGNHSRDHLVMAGLSPERQAREVAEASATLASFPQRKSRLFAVPFGGAPTYDQATLASVTAAGLAGLAVTADGLCAADDLSAHPLLAPGRALVRCGGAALARRRPQAWPV
ncbi:MAG: hypothetical protein Kilf2KO_07590 [Rhodospirillales bacterium]